MLCLHLATYDAFITSFRVEGEESQVRIFFQSAFFLLETLETFKVSSVSKEMPRMRLQPQRCREALGVVEFVCLVCGFCVVCV